LKPYPDPIDARPRCVLSDRNPSSATVAWVRSNLIVPAALEDSSPAIVSPSPASGLPHNPPDVIGDDKRRAAIDAGHQMNRGRAEDTPMHAVLYSVPNEFVGYA